MLKCMKQIFIEAFRLFEGPLIDPPAKYAGLIKTVLLTSFYASALPFSMIYTILGLVLTYWTDKVSRATQLTKSIYC
jgi:hypothetical protein